MKRKNVLSLAAGMVAILLLSLVIVSVALSAKGGNDLPFKATLAGEAHWEFPGTSPSNCVDLTTFMESAGQATHMGRIEAFSSHCPTQPDYLTDGYITLVAANGDELNGTYDYDPTSESNEIPVTLNGGTGLFAEASGAVTLTYDVIPEFIPECDPDPDPFVCLDFTVPWQWSATLVGTISY